MKSRRSPDDLHGHLDVAPLGELLHRVELRHESVPNPPTRTRHQRKPYVFHTHTQTPPDEAETKGGVSPELTGVGAGRDGMRS
jgi:hypothetical protein